MYLHELTITTSNNRVFISKVFTNEENPSSNDFREMAMEQLSDAYKGIEDVRDFYPEDSIVERTGGTFIYDGLCWEFKERKKND